MDENREDEKEYTEDIVKELTDEHIKAVIDEKERREELRLKAEREGFMQRPKIVGICPGCKSWWTEEDIRRYKVCPVCGSEKVTAVE